MYSCDIHTEQLSCHIDVSVCVAINSKAGSIIYWKTFADLNTAGAEIKGQKLAQQVPSIFSLLSLTHHCATRWKSINLRLQHMLCMLLTSLTPLPWWPTTTDGHVSKWCHATYNDWALLSCAITSVNVSGAPLNHGVNSTHQKLRAEFKAVLRSSAEDHQYGTCIGVTFCCNLPWLSDG